MTQDDVLELIKKYDKEEYGSLMHSDAGIIEDHLDWLAEKYSKEELEKNLQRNPKFTRT